MSEYVDRDADGISVGIVEKKFFTFARPPEPPLTLESGAAIAPVTVAYETYGRLSPAKDNVVLILHALSGDCHVAGYHSQTEAKPGWWESMVGPGKGIDTDRYFVICSSILGSCGGTTGPCSPDPNTGKPYGLNFPLVTVGDMVEVQQRLLQHLGIERLLAVVGGSLGGMQALEWSLRYPDKVAGVIALATTMRHSALAIAFNEISRQAIMADPNWQRGHYYGAAKPDTGLAVARMIGHVTYLSDEAMRRKFGRRLQNKEDFSFQFDIDFQVESYLRHQGSKFVERFDANSFLYVTKAADYFDLERRGGAASAVEAFAGVRSRFLVTSFTSDWLYPTYQSKELVRALKKSGANVSFCEIKADCGHDAFLLPNRRLSGLIGNFLERTREDCAEQARLQPATVPADPADSPEASHSGPEAADLPATDLNGDSTASGRGTPQLAASGAAMGAPAREPARSSQDEVPRDRSRLLRFDLSVIASWIEPGSRVLDLGCGEGDLLHHLKTEKNIHGTGIEMVEAKALRCIEKGLSVLQGDITEEVADFGENTFDYVILSQTLQQVYAPAQLLHNLLTVGRRVVVSFPNFTHWKNRWQLGWQGRAPISKQLPFEWYNTPNIRVIAITDFRRFVKKMNWRIQRETAINTDHHDQHGNVVRLLPNLRATYGIFMLTRKEKN